MRFTYRTYRIALNVLATYAPDAFGTLQLSTEAWGFIIWNAQGQQVAQQLADDEDAFEFFSSGLNAAIALINQLISDSEQPPELIPVTTPF